MRKLLPLLALPLLALGTVAAAEDEAVVNEPCEETDALTSGVHEVSLAAPMLPGDSNSVSFVVDLSEYDRGDRATVTVSMPAQDPGNVQDYDLTFEGDQPFLLGSEETAAGRVRHCRTATATVENFAAVGAYDIVLTVNIP